MALALQVLGTAFAWIALFHLNHWFFGFFDWAPLTINWVFLPAGVRLLSVMTFGRRGGAGLWLGTLATNGVSFGTEWVSVVVATLSAGGALAAVYLTRRWLRVPVTLHGLTAGQLVCFALVGALCNSVPHNLFFWVIDLVASPFIGLVPMFIGDLTGTVIVLYLIRAALLLVERFARLPTV